MVLEILKIACILEYCEYLIRKRWVAKLILKFWDRDYPNFDINILTSLHLCTSQSSGTGKLTSSMNTFSFFLSLAPYTKPAEVNNTLNKTTKLRPQEEEENKPDPGTY